MRNLLNPLLGLLMPSTVARPDERPALIPPRAIVGGNAARELCMLPTDGTHDVIASIQAKRAVQLKGDGIRALYLHGRVVSREGVPLNCAMHCQPALRRIEETAGHEMMFDGEYIAPDGFNATIGEMRGDVGAGTFWLFDAVPLGAWVAGGSDIRLQDRLAWLKGALPAADSPFVGMFDWWEIDGQATIAKAAELWALGYEGVVSKRLDSPYVRDRSHDWLRLKRTFTQDLTVMDVLVKAGTLKAIMVRGPEGVGPIKLGKGWSAEDEREIVRRFTAGRDLTVEVSYQLTTGTRRSVRGAVFHRLRTDKGALA